MKYFLLLFTISVMISCTVQKRMYQPGLHIEWRGNQKNLNVEKPSSSEIQLTNLVIHDTKHENIGLKTEKNDVPDSLLTVKNPLEILTISEVGQSSLKIKETEAVSSFISASIHHVTQKQQLIKSKVKTQMKNSKGWSFFYWLIIFYCLLLMTGGVCALIFGQHWSLILLGIIAIVFASIALITFLISVALGKKIAREMKNTWVK